MTSKRIIENLEQEKARKKTQKEINDSWNDGVRVHASDVLNNGDKAWKHVPREMKKAVKDRLGIGEVEQRIVTPELGRLLAVAPKREGINVHLELADMVRNGTVGQGRESEKPVDAGTHMSNILARMKSKYSPTS